MKRHPSSTISTRTVLLGASAIVGLTALAAMPAMSQSPQVGAPPEAKNMRLVGYNDLQARSAYQPVIHRHGDRYIAYIGHHGGTNSVAKPVNPITGQAEFNGTSIIDVTDPKNPKYLAHVPGDEGVGRGRRRADGAPVRRQDAAEGRSQRGLHAAGVRQPGTRGLERRRSCLPQEDQHRFDRSGEHAQELVGMRHRHRLPGVGCEGMGGRAA
jgi:hypothetical protein